MSSDLPAPEGIDVTRPSAARVYDYLLGGRDNYQVDRLAVEAMGHAAPYMKALAVENRRFLVRAVRQLAADGIDQFLDLGSGLPTRQNVHEVAQEINPDARVVYVDRDPSVLAHARALLGDDSHTAYVHADVRSPGEVLDAPRTRALIDFGRPVAVLMVAVLHFVADEDDPAGLVERYAGATATGSRVVASAGSSDDLTEKMRQRLRNYFADGPTTLHLRPKAAIAEWFGALDVVPPGVVRVSDWPEPSQSETLPFTLYAGMARVA